MERAFGLAPPPEGLSYWTADLHIHIGRAGDRPVKITAARDLTFANIALEASERKGVDIVGIIDCASPAVLHEIQACLDTGEMEELPGGGIQYTPRRDGCRPTVIILAAELETRERASSEEGAGISHHIGFFPTLASIQEFSNRLRSRVRNLTLSSQNCRMRAIELLELVEAHGGFLIPAHAFTPHKSLYGSAARRLTALFAPEADRVFALELGLSADSHLADRLSELHPRTFVTNSDAHSLPKIAREYNILCMASPTFEELRRVLRREQGRGVAANYGMDPRLGKYHRTFCETCRHVEVLPPPVLHCSLCGTERVTCGVLDRIVEIQDFDAPQTPAHRPPYRYQVPLQFLPKIGPVTLDRLLNRFHTEMNVLHFVPAEDLAHSVGETIAETILQARAGTLALMPGGGGRYGRAVTHEGQTQMRLF